MKITENETPLKLVRKYARMLDGCYDDLDFIKNSGASWGEACHIPCSAATAVLTERGKLSGADATKLCAELTALYIWRKNKIIYRFDHDLAQELRIQAEDTKDTDNLPIDLLMHLPYDCIYVKTDVFGSMFDGFFSWIEFDTNREEYEIRIQLMHNSMECTFPLMLHLSKPTMGECLLETVREAAKYTNSPSIFPVPMAKNATMITTAIQLILYLVSENNDVEEDVNQKKITRSSSTGEIKDKFREIKLENVGVRIGNAIRKAKNTSGHGPKRSNDNGTKKRTHLRRAHWHHYWIGAKDSPDRKLKLKWIAPTIVNPDGEPDNIVIYPIK